MTTPRPNPTSLEARRLWIWINYEGPFAKVCNVLWLVDAPHDEDGNPLDPQRVIEDGSLRDRLAVIFERFDYKWRNHYAKDFRDPPKRWKRRP